MMGETPDLSHLSPLDYDSIYEPAEDTFLFMDALLKDFESIKRLRPLVCLEVGCGSGAISAFLVKILGPGAIHFCTDINDKATVATVKTGAQNRVDLNPIQTDLVSALVPRLEGLVDVLLFNPPYVVTPDEEVGGRGIEASWAGGARGRRVMDRFFPFVSQLLSPRGIFYLVVIKENDAGDRIMNIQMTLQTVCQNLSFAWKLS